jgi:hypothetical protein
LEEYPFKDADLIKHRGSLARGQGYLHYTFIIIQFDLAPQAKQLVARRFSSFFFFLFYFIPTHVVVAAMDIPHTLELYHGHQ